MTSILLPAYGKFRSIFGVERAQDAFEYLLVVGGVSVGIVLAMVAVPGLTTALVTSVCNAIDTIPNITIVC